MKTEEQRIQENLEFAIAIVKQLESGHTLPGILMYVGQVYEIWKEQKRVSVNPSK